MSSADNKPITQKASEAMQSAGQTVADTWEATKAKAGEMTGLAQEKADQAGKAAQDNTGSAWEQTKGKAAELGNRAGEAAEQVKHSAQETATEARHKADEATRPGANPRR